MTTNAADMLRLLGSGVRPAGVPATAQSRSIEGSSFAELLAGVQKGEVASGQPLSVKKTLDASFTPSQLERLSTATDAAEASGASRVLAVIDNQAVTIDVASRTVEAVSPWVPGSVTTDVDAVMMIPDEGAPLDGLFAGVGAVASSAGNLLSGLVNSGSRSLNNLLASLSNPDAPAQAVDESTN
jgi:hypothetical protein